MHTFFVLLQVDLLAWAVPIGSTSPAFSSAVHVTG